MRQREKQRLNEQAATLVMQWERKDNDWFYGTEWVGYSVEPKVDTVFPTFNPVEEIAHAWLLIGRTANSKVFDVDIFGLRAKEAACRITQAAINATLEARRK